MLLPVSCAQQPDSHCAWSVQVLAQTEPSLMVWMQTLPSQQGLARHDSPAPTQAGPHNSPGGAQTRVRPKSMQHPSPTSLPRGAERLQLLTGRIEVDVPEDGAKRAFSVATPDTLVMVRGTKFTVEVADVESPDGSVTSVRVARGQVEVQTIAGRTTLQVGNTWSSNRAATKQQAATPSPEHNGPEASQTQGGGTDNPPESAAAGAKRTPTSLGGENRIYQDAMRAKLRGRDERVVRRLDALLQRYPKSPLAPDARVERFRALKRLGRHQEAARSARKYLAEHPEGFAQDEARDLALGLHGPAGGEEE
jgi:hypothetical protein